MISLNLGQRTPAAQVIQQEIDYLLEESAQWFTVGELCEIMSWDGRQIDTTEKQQRMRNEIWNMKARVEARKAKQPSSSDASSTTV